MTRLRKLVPAVVIFSLVCQSSLRAQAPALAVVTGTIYLSDGATPAVGVTITLANRTLRKTAVADEKGHYRIEAPLGTYSLGPPAALGRDRFPFFAFHYETVFLKSGAPATIDFDVERYGTVVRRLLDVDGKPIANAQVFFQGRSQRGNLGHATYEPDPGTNPHYA